jgi:FtsH-binding integral membrane protein
MHSGMLSFLIGVLGVFVFTGLTAYYMQQFKKISQDANISALERSKLTIVGGLMLYILFINLFLSLLRILGSRE